MAFAPWWLLIIIKPRHQSIFCVNRFWSLNLLFNERDFTCRINYGQILHFNTIFKSIVSSCPHPKLFGKIALIINLIFKNSTLKELCFMSHLRKWLQMMLHFLNFVPNWNLTFKKLSSFWDCFIGLESHTLISMFISVSTKNLRTKFSYKIGCCLILQHYSISFYWRVILTNSPLDYIFFLCPPFLQNF